MITTETYRDFIVTYYDHCRICGPNRTCGHYGFDPGYITPRYSNSTTVYVDTYSTTRTTATLHVARQDDLRPVPATVPMPPFPERLRGQPGRRAAAAPKHLLMLNARSRR